MKTIKEFETVIWIISSILFIIGFAITGLDTFLQLSMVCVIMARIVSLKNEIKNKDQ